MVETLDDLAQQPLELGRAVPQAAADRAGECIQRRVGQVRPCSARRRTGVDVVRLEEEEIRQ